METSAPPLPLPIREGTVWCWEPLKPHARCDVRITETRWNGEEWLVECEMLTADQYTPAGSRYWNELDRFIEAAVFRGDEEFPVDTYRLSSRPGVVGGGA
ncbi:hypothetical protein [Streptomyces sp. 351MFTsu5.1]|uniref:hypothetical protein n=1 Tax=Streptomyces sp. 351MFTsu5.1 TaxID=1172180 RepID=UPI00131A3997|nr:hypothetical protein [Streptomyces sp. 351MFTsu5.1]